MSDIDKLVLGTVVFILCIASTVCFAVTMHQSSITRDCDAIGYTVINHQAYQCKPIKSNTQVEHGQP